MIKTAALWICAALAVTGCNIGQVPVQAEDKDFLTDARAAVNQLRGEYVLTKGLAGLLQQKADEFLYIEDGLRLGRVKWKKFRGELRACWDTPVETIENAPAAAVDIGSAAKAFKANKALHELKAVRTAGQNAFDRVKACPQSLADKVVGFPRRAKEEAKAWAYTKFTVLNEARVLVKDELPSRLEGLSQTAVDAPARVGKQLAAAQNYQKTLEQLRDEKAIQRNSRQIQQLQKLQRDSKALSNRVQADARELSAMVGETSGRVTAGFQTFGKRR